MYNYKSKVLHLERNNPTHQYRLGTSWVGSNSAEKDTLDNNLKMSQQHALGVTRGIDHSCRKGNSNSLERNIFHFEGHQTLEAGTSERLRNHHP